MNGICAARKLVPTADAQGLGEAVGKEWYYPEWSNHPYYAAASLNLGDKSVALRDLWRRQDLPAAQGIIRQKLVPHGSVLLRLMS